MLPYRDSRLTKIAIGVFFVIVAGYAYFEARGLLFGPHISLSSEKTEVHEQLISIQGKADRISSLLMNGKPVTVTENGAFNEPYLLAVGLNRVVLDAKDRYGRTRQQVIQIVYTPLSATSTDSTTLTTGSLQQTSPGQTAASTSAAATSIPPIASSTPSTEPVAQ